MISTGYHLAELNIALLRAPLTDPSVADFVNNLDRINRVADGTPGFVWRLQTEDGDATALRVFDDNRIIVNLTVWESVEALFQYTYESDHTAIYRRRREWFHKLDTPAFVMWWIPAGQLPTVEEAKSKLEYLTEHGPTPLAFTFKQRFSIQDMLRQTEQG